MCEYLSGKQCKSLGSVDKKKKKKSSVRPRFYSFSLLLFISKQLLAKIGNGILHFVRAIPIDFIVLNVNNTLYFICRTHTHTHTNQIRCFSKCHNYGCALALYRRSLAIQWNRNLEYSARRRKHSVFDWIFMMIKSIIQRFSFFFFFSFLLIVVHYCSSMHNIGWERRLPSDSTCVSIILIESVVSVFLCILYQAIDRNNWICRLNWHLNRRSFEPNSLTIRWSFNSKFQMNIHFWNCENKIWILFFFSQFATFFFRWL